MSGVAIPSQIAVDEEEIVKTLFQLGYFGAGWDEVKRFTADNRETLDAVAQYREFNGLDAGAVDDDLVAHLMRPRCGLPDMMARADAQLCRWPMLDVAAAQNIGGLNPLAADVERAVYVEALANWNAVCGLRLKLVEFGSSGINIRSEIGPCSRGVLAYSYLPCGAGSTTQLQQIYNRATNWTRSLLLQVATHEIGHALGLDHGPQGALMQPTADGRITKPQAWDIEQIRQRYGDPKPGKDPSPLPGGTPAPGPVDPKAPAIVLSAPLAAGRYFLTNDPTGALGAADWGL